MSPSGTTPRLPPLDAARSFAPESTSDRWSFDQPPDQGCSYHAPVKATCCSQPRTPSVDSTPPCRRSLPQVHNDSPHFSRPEHQLCNPPENPPCHGDGSRRIATLRHLRRRGAACSAGMMLLTNLCNRFIVMRTPRMPSSQARGLAPFRPPRPTRLARPCSHTHARAALSTATPASHCWHHRP
jgi:hypothetical protein